MIRIISDDNGFGLSFDSESEVDIVAGMLRRLKKHKRTRGQSYPGVIGIWDDTDPGYAQKATDTIWIMAECLRANKTKKRKNGK